MLRPWSRMATNRLSSPRPTRLTSAAKYARSGRCGGARASWSTTCSCMTGGLAAARFKRDWTYFEDGPATTGFFSDSKTRYGWAAGFGTEWCLFDNWSLKSEVLYMRFSQDRTTVTGNGIIGSAGVPYRI